MDKTCRNLVSGPLAVAKTHREVDIQAAPSSVSLGSGSYLQGVGGGCRESLGVGVGGDVFLGGEGKRWCLVAGPSTVVTPKVTGAAGGTCSPDH